MNKFVCHVAHELRKQWLNLLFLVALATVIHEFHLFEFFRPWTPQSMRIVHRVEQKFLNWGGKQMEALLQNEPQVTLLLVPPDAHLQMFCGLTPTPRGQLADALTTMADVINKQMCATLTKPVIGIDIDVAPVTHKSLWVEQCGTYMSSGKTMDALGAENAAKMKRALEQLAESADIVAITTPRASLEDTQDRDKWLGANLPKNMQIATPFEWFDVGEPDYRFLRSKCSEPSCAYPSLGNLMGRAASPAASASSAPAFERSVLEYIDGSRDGQRPKDYEWAYLDLLRGSLRVSVRLISTFDDLESAVSDWVQSTSPKDEKGKCADAPPSAGKARPMLLLSLDDGSSDKHFSVMDTHALSSGSYLQAVRAVSFKEPLAPQVHEHLWKGALLDLVIGVCYLGVWAAATFGIGLVAGRGLLFLAGALTFVGPLAITLGLGSVAALFAAWRLSVGQWFDPLLILVGLTVHAYMMVWELGVEPALLRARRAPGDRLLSLPWLWTRWTLWIAVGLCTLALATRLVVYCGHHDGYCVRCPSPKEVGS